MLVKIGNKVLNGLWRVVSMKVVEISKVTRFVWFNGVVAAKRFMGSRDGDSRIKRNLAQRSFFLTFHRKYRTTPNAGL